MKWKYAGWLLLFIYYHEDTGPTHSKALSLLTMASVIFTPWRWTHHISRLAADFYWIRLKIWWTLWVCRCPDCVLRPSEPVKPMCVSSSSCVDNLIRRFQVGFLGGVSCGGSIIRAVCGAETDFLLSAKIKIKRLISNLLKGKDWQLLSESAPTCHKRPAHDGCSLPSWCAVYTGWENFNGDFKGPVF